MPFVGAENLERHFFAAAEGVAFGEFVAHTGSDLLIAFKGGVHFKRAVEEFVHDGMNHEIQGVARQGRGVARHVGQVHLAQHTHCADFLHRGLIVAEAIFLSRAVGDGVTPDGGAERHFVAGERIGVASASERLVGDVVLVAAEVNVDIPNVPRSVGFFGATGDGLHL